MRSCSFNRHTLVPARVIRSRLIGTVWQPLQFKSGWSRHHWGPGSVATPLRATGAPAVRHHSVSGRLAERQARPEAARVAAERIRDLEEKLHHPES